MTPPFQLQVPAEAGGQDNHSSKVLIVTASVGSGHNQAARAIEDILRRQMSRLDVTVIDSLDFVSRGFRLKYAGGYSAAVSRFPRLYGVGYHLMDRPRGPRRTLFERRRLRSERRRLERLRRYVCERRPDLIVHTHFLAPPALRDLCDESNLNIPQIVVTTDVIPHRWWYCEGMYRWFVAHKVGQSRLEAFGINSARIIVSGIPVHAKWTQTLPPPETIRRNWRLPAEGKIVLLSGGTEFICGPVAPIARAMAAARADTCVVVLAGRNKKLLQRLAGLPETRQGRIAPMGFTDRLPELASVADLMITKAGGLTTAECLAKRLPMLLLPPVPGQERLNAGFLAEHGAARIAGRNRDVARLAAEMLDDSEALRAMSVAAGTLYRPGGEIIAQTVQEAFSERRGGGS